MTLRITVSAESHLQEMVLYGCSSLVALPTTLGACVSLTLLDLRLCVALAELPPSIAEMPKLQKLLLHGCVSLRALPPLRGLMWNLEVLDLSRCSRLVELPDDIEELRMLHTLVLEGCALLPLTVRVAFAKPPREPVGSSPRSGSPGPARGRSGSIAA